MLKASFSRLLFSFIAELESGTDNPESLAYPGKDFQQELGIGPLQFHYVGTDRLELLLVPGPACSSQRIVVEYAAFVAAESLVAPSVNLLPAYRTFSAFHLRPLLISCFRVSNIEEEVVFYSPR